MANDNGKYMLAMFESRADMTGSGTRTWQRMARQGYSSLSAAKRDADEFVKGWVASKRRAEVTHVDRHGHESKPLYACGEERA